MHKVGAKSRNAVSRRSHSKVDDGGVIVVPNEMKRSHARPPEDAPGLCLANPCRVMLIGGCGASKTTVCQSMLARGATVEGLAAEALDKLGDSAERAAERAIIDPAPTARVPAAPAARALPAAATRSSSKRRKMKGAGHAAGLMGPEPFAAGGFVTAPAFDAAMLPAGATTVSLTNHLQQVY